MDRMVCPMAQLSKPEAQELASIARDALQVHRDNGTVQGETLPALPVRRRTGEPDKALLPRILSDEIAFRSELLSRVETAENALLTAIDRGLYSIDKASLPALANSLAKLVQVSERIVERTKGIATPKQGETIAGLYAKYALLQEALRDRGLVGTDGRLRNRAQAIAAIDVDAHPAPAFPPASEQGGMTTGSLSDGGAPGRSEPSSLPPLARKRPGVGAGASPGSPTDEPLQGDPDLSRGVIVRGELDEPASEVLPMPDELLPLGPESEFDRPKTYRRRRRKKQKGK